MKLIRHGLSAATLRWLALGCMLLDHLWGTVVPGNNWMNYVGRLAFPIFAFQIAEGYLHTHDFKKYSRRLGLFALISEIPFDMMLFGAPFFPFQQNVMVTLWLGLHAIHVIDLVRSRQRKPLLGAVQLAGLFLLGVVLFPDYGLLGLLNVVLFYLLRGFPGAWAAQLAGMTAIHMFGFQGLSFPVSLFGSVFYIPSQSFAILALIPIWLYNGKKGVSSPALSYFSYVFYPAHMLLLALLGYAQ